jgi:hypothetical protein
MIVPSPLYPFLVTSYKTCPCEQIYDMNNQKRPNFKPLYAKHTANTPFNFICSIITHATICLVRENFLSMNQLTMQSSNSFPEHANIIYRAYTKEWCGFKGEYN